MLWLLECYAARNNPFPYFIPNGSAHGSGQKQKLKLSHRIMNMTPSPFKISGLSGWCHCDFQKYGFSSI